MREFWYAVLERTLGGWIAARTPPPAPGREFPPGGEYFDEWSRDPEHCQQTKKYLPDEESWFDWFGVFTPDDAVLVRDNRRVDPAPVSFPCVVVATRRLGSGLVRADFYWDFVYPEDFQGYIVPSSPQGPGQEMTPPDASPITGTPGQVW